MQRGRVPIVVGGTGLYLRWLIEGRPKTPKSDPDLAAQTQATLDQVRQHVHSPPTFQCNQFTLSVAFSGCSCPQTQLRQCTCFCTFQMLAFLAVHMHFGHAASHLTLSSARNSPNATWQNFLPSLSNSKWTS